MRPHGLPVRVPHTYPLSVPPVLLAERRGCRSRVPACILLHYRIMKTVRGLNIPFVFHTFEGSNRVCMKISIIISVYNDWAWLEMILTALARQKSWGGEFEVVVADDGSGAEMTARIAAAAAGGAYPFPIVHVWHEDRGWRKNIILNAAVRASRGDYLMFLDGDCIPHPRWMAEHWAARTPGRVIAGRRVNLPQGLSARLTPRRVASGYLQRMLPWMLWRSMRGDGSHAENAVRITWKPLRRYIRERTEGLIGCNFSIFRSDLLSVNGFDERYLDPATGEDTDLEARLHRAGVIVRTLKHLITVYHKCHRTQSYASERNAAIFAENNRLGMTRTPYGIEQVR